MIRYVFLFLALIALIVVPTQAADFSDSGIGFSKSNRFEKSSFKAGRVAFDVIAEGRVDVASLLADLDLSRSATAEEIADRVNEARKRLYPDEEIILSVAPPQNAIVKAEKAGLVKAIYWWNNTTCSNCYWFAEYSSSVAVMFVSEIQYGAYNIYDKVGGGNYIFRNTVDGGDSTARTTYGSRTTRGFRGYAAGVSSRAHVVLYFFR